MSDSLLVDHLIKEEGLRTKPYRDHLGYLTIGVGRLLDERKGGGISVAEAKYLLNNDIARVEAELDIRLPWWRKLDRIRQIVLLSMAFQMGTYGLLSFHNTLRYVEQGDYTRAAANMLRSLWAQQTSARANRLAKAMATGDPASL